VLAGMTEAQRVGQLLMVDCPTTGVASATVSAIQTYHVGSVILDGTTHQGLTATKAVTDHLQGLAPASVKLLISTDQEGGLVQRLQGSGFSTIPSALQQGTWYHGTLWYAATKWAQQLHAAGVNVNLAPVADTVPPGDTNNPPIGDLDREFGHYPTTVSPHVLAFFRGMAQGGVDATVKHFPGLGRVTGNTDTTSGVRDTVTGPNDPYLQPFQAAVQANVPLVMMSTAIYTKIDPYHPAAFSSTIVTGILRQRFGFGGVVISDDLGNAKQVSGYSIGSRAVDFIRAGGDLVLTVNATQAAAMTSALLQEASASSSFRALVDASALRVLKAKSALGLLH
jgi:beta-N-acetylhexosaminidase